MVNQNWNSSITTVDRQKGEVSVFQIYKKSSSYQCSTGNLQTNNRPTCNEVAAILLNTGAE
jgi:hypothetical protein